jgi:hypothetical protein
MEMVKAFSRRLSVAQRMPRRISVVVAILSLAGIFFVPFHLAHPSLPLQREPAAPVTLLPEPPPAWRDARHLVVVAGHAVYTAAGRDERTLADEASWFLEPFQHGQLSTMLSHIRRGVELAAADNASLLLFSGGETRASAGPRSEAASYWEAADASAWFGRPQVRGRAALEAQARDSFENLLFSVCRFRELSGSYPELITVVSFAFKRWRFEELHRAALRFPRSRFGFEGLDPPGLPPSVLEGEKARSAKPFERDPYGCADAGLQQKRRERNPFRRSVSYPQGCPELAPLFAHCTPELYRGPLPWKTV